MLAEQKKYYKNRLKDGNYNNQIFVVPAGLNKVREVVKSAAKSVWNGVKSVGSKISKGVRSLGRIFFDVSLYFLRIKFKQMGGIQ